MNLKRAYIKTLNYLHRPFVRKATQDPFHSVFQEFVALGNALEKPAVLEIGSRNVSGITRRDIFPDHSEYIGFDVRDGDNVDMVGDAHALSQHLPRSHFDLVYSTSVFEHLLFPWKVVMETNLVMKPGGYLFASTHPTWQAHELPWDFWRFPKNGFHALFNKYTGFEIVSLVDGLPCRAYSLTDDPPTRKLFRFTMNLGVAVIAKKVSEYQREKLHWDISPSDILETMYPPNNSDASRKK